MNAHRMIHTTRTAVVAFSFAMLLAGCKGPTTAPDDASLNAKVTSTLAADQNLSGQTIQASAAAGVVTLNGTVTSDTARDITTSDVSQIAGVKTVVDNLVVQSAPVAAAPPPAVKTAPPPASSAKARKPTPMVAAATPPPAPVPVVRTPPAALPSPPPPPPPPVVAKAQAPAPPPAPPAPVVHNITLSAGTVIPVRITQTLDSASTKAGDKFTGEIATDLIDDGLVVLPQGTPVTGHVDEAQDATHYKGSALLTLSLIAIDRKGTHIEVSTQPYTKQGEGRGKNTAEKVGGGTALGAILGGIIGGGKGAAIGAVAGAGAGAGANTVTRGQQVQIPSESVVRFQLLDPILIHVTSGANTPENSNSSLGRRSDQ
ncbi:MAG: BON domain-containing protein [Acidobacteriaceae bacterium]